MEVRSSSEGGGGEPSAASPARGGAGTESSGGAVAGAWGLRRKRDRAQGRPLHLTGSAFSAEAIRRSLSPSPAPRARLSLRLVMWLVLVVGALVVVEQFVLGPRRPVSQGPTARSHWDAPLVPLGEACLSMPGLSEVSPVRLPCLAGFPEGAVPCVQRQLDTSVKRGLPIEVENSVGMRFRLVPAGSCRLGSPAQEAGHSVVESSHPGHFLEPFYLGKTEVTQGQWEAVMGQGGNPSHFRGADLPVEEVSWLQCQEFVRRLNEREGLPAHTYRLPSEAEWEYACRGGTETAYCYGDDVERLEEWADYAGNNYRRTSPVGQRRPNSLGLLDMHGNVWEWCRDYYRNYPGDATPRSAAHGFRCIRGGNWYVSGLECRSANRSRLPDRSAGNMLGFRVMRICPAED